MANEKPVIVIKKKKGGHGGHHGGAWKIARRTVVFEWTTVEPIVREWKLTDDYQRGSRSRDDPVYETGVLPCI